MHRSKPGQDNSRQAPGQIFNDLWSIEQADEQDDQAAGALVDRTVYPGWRVLDKANDFITILAELFEKFAERKCCEDE